MSYDDALFLTSKINYNDVKIRLQLKSDIKDRELWMNRKGSLTVEYIHKSFQQLILHNLDTSCNIHSSIHQPFNLKQFYNYDTRDIHVDMTYPRFFVSSFTFTYKLMHLKSSKFSL